MNGDLLERCAEAAYDATCRLGSDSVVRRASWDALPEWWRRSFRAQAKAVLEMAELSQQSFHLEGIA